MTVNLATLSGGNFPTGVLRWLKSDLIAIDAREGSTARSNSSRRGGIRIVGANSGAAGKPKFVEHARKSVIKEKELVRQAWTIGLRVWSVSHFYSPQP